MGNPQARLSPPAEVRAEVRVGLREEKAASNGEGEQSPLPFHITMTRGKLFKKFLEGSHE